MKNLKTFESFSNETELKFKIYDPNGKVLDIFIPEEKIVKKPHRAYIQWGLKSINGSILLLKAYDYKDEIEAEYTAPGGRVLVYFDEEGLETIKQLFALNRQAINTTRMPLI